MNHNSGNKDEESYAENSGPDLPPQKLKELEDRFTELAQFVKHDHDFFEEFSTPKIGRFVIRDLLCEDGNSVVFSALDPDLNRQVVIKTRAVGATADNRKSLLREGRALCQLDVPQVVRCIAIDEYDGGPFLVLEHVTGVNLAEWRENDQNEQAATGQIIPDLISGLRAVHERGLLHLDLKPQNVIVTDSGTAKIVDFGMASPISDVPIDKISGTLAFMAPEVANNRVSQIDQRTDIFGIGAVIYFLITGSALYDGPTRNDLLTAARSGNFKPPSHLTSTTNSDLESICLKCLQINPNDRFQSVLELEQAFELSHPPSSGSCHQSKIENESKNRVESKTETRSFGTVAFGTVAIGAALVFTILLVGVAVWYFDPFDASVPPIIIPTTTGIARLKADQLPLEIKLKITLQQNVDGEYQEIVADSQDVYHINADSEFRLTVSPETSCWIALFNYQSVDESLKLERELAFPDPKQQYHFAPGDAFEIVFTPTPTTGDANEYLLIVAFAKQWEPTQVAEADVLTPELIQSVKRQFRGLNKTSDQMSLKLLPYRVR